MQWLRKEQDKRHAKDERFEDREFASLLDEGSCTPWKIYLPSHLPRNDLHECEALASRPIQWD